MVLCDGLLQTKLNALACIDRLLDSLDKMMILDEVLPFLTEMNCQDVDIIMSVICKSNSNPLPPLNHTLCHLVYLPAFRLHYSTGVAMHNHTVWVIETKLTESSTALSQTTFL